MGKTVYAINWLVQQILQCDKINPQGFYFCPLLKQARSVAWKYLREFTQWIPGVTDKSYNKSELTVTLPNGGTIQLCGADNVDGWRGNYADAAVLDEVAQMPVPTWGEVIRPALADRKGKALWIGTPKGPNMFFRRYEAAANDPNWFRVKLTWSDTGLLDDEEIQQMRREMDEYEWAQEMECDFHAAVKGAFYGQVLKDCDTEGRITSVPYDPQLPVYTAWDLGIADATAVVFIQLSPGGEVRFIDYEEYHGASLVDIIADIRKKPYRNYGRHIAPHDIRVRELGSGVSRMQVASNNGLHFDVCPNIPLMDGIDATRGMLRRAWFDKTKCERLLDYLRLYRSEENPKTGVLSTRPLHDHTSHAADSVRMFAVAMGGQSFNDDMFAGELDYSAMNRMAV